MDELMAKQAALRARQARERALKFGADQSQYIDGLSVDLLEQAQEITAVGPAPQARASNILDRYDQSLQENLAIKHAQVECIESRLELLAELQSTQLQQTMAQRPGKFALPSARARWTDQQQRQLASLQRVQLRLQQVREIRDGSVAMPPALEVFARKRLERTEPGLASDAAGVLREQRDAQIQAVKTEQEAARVAREAQATLQMHRGVRQALTRSIGR